MCAGSRQQIFWASLAKLQNLFFQPSNLGEGFFQKRPARCCLPDAAGHDDLFRPPFKDSRLQHGPFPIEEGQAQFKRCIAFVFGNTQISEFQRLIRMSSEKCSLKSARMAVWDGRGRRHNFIHGRRHSKSNLIDDTFPFPENSSVQSSFKK